MVTYAIDVDEWYPVFTITAKVEGWHDVTAPVPPEIVARVAAALKEFAAVQEELRKIYEANGGRAR